MMHTTLVISMKEKSCSHTQVGQNGYELL